MPLLTPKQLEWVHDSPNEGVSVVLGLGAAVGVFLFFRAQGFLEFPAGKFGVVVCGILGYWIASRGVVLNGLMCLCGIAIIVGVLLLFYRWVFGEFPPVPGLESFLA